MKYYRHGLSIGIERTGNLFFLTLKAVGKLTHEDYRQITPMIDAALDEVREPEVLVLIDASEMEGWELRAAWDDFKLGLKHGNKFSKIAVFGSRKWMKNVSGIAGWFVSGEVKFFEDVDEALDWLHQ